MNRTKTIHTPEYCFFIQALCAERKRLGLSQLEVAEAIGMGQSEISKIESIERRIDILELKQLLKVYRVQNNEKLKRLIIMFFEMEVK